MCTYDFFKERSSSASWDVYLRAIQLNVIRNVFSRPRVIFNININNGKFELVIKRSEVVLFDEILNVLELNTISFNFVLLYIFLNSVN